jgi:hypothetical protein
VGTPLSWHRCIDQASGDADKTTAVIGAAFSRGPATQEHAMSVYTLLIIQYLYLNDVVYFFPFRGTTWIAVLSVKKKHRNHSGNSHVTCECYFVAFLKNERLRPLPQDIFVA